MLSYKQDIILKNGDIITYNIIFYETQDGNSEIWNFLEELRHKSATSKDARIQYNQAELYIQLLQDNGTKLSLNIMKHIDEDIWELRPGNNRIFFFACDRDVFVLLHGFRKKTQKTPRREIVKAKTERDDYLSRREDSDL